jgi:hypothetical protein
MGWSCELSNITTQKKAFKKKLWRLMIENLAILPIPSRESTRGTEETSRPRPTSPTLHVASPTPRTHVAPNIARHIVGLIKSVFSLGSVEGPVEILNFWHVATSPTSVGGRARPRRPRRSVGHVARVGRLVAHAARRPLGLI